MDWWWTVAALVLHLGPTDDDRWARVLMALDHQRTQAFADADPSVLDRVYADGVGDPDAAVIEQYAERGGRVVGAVLRIESLRVATADADRVRLEVVDRLGPARVTWDDGSSTRLPRDRATRREVVLVRTDDGWRIASTRVTPP